MDSRYFFELHFKGYIAFNQVVREDLKNAVVKSHPFLEWVDQQKKDQESLEIKKDDQELAVSGYKFCC